MKMPNATKSLSARNGTDRRRPTRNRPLAVRVVLTFLAALAGMTAYESLKQVLLPTVTVWESHTITICVGALLAAGTICLAERRHRAMLRALADREDLLRESEENLSITLHSIGDAVIATDTAGRVVRMNPVGEQLTGWALAEAAGRPLSEVFRIVNARTREPVADPLEKAMKTGEVVALANDTALIARDGSERQIADSAAPIRDAQGRIRGAVLVFHDVTAAYEAKKALRRLAVIAEQAAEGIAVAGLDGGNLQFVNLAWARMHGYESGAELVGRHLRIFHTDEQLRTEVAPFNAAVKRQGHHAGEVGHVRRDGTTFPTQMSVVVLKDEQGEPYGLAALAEDITDRKRVEEERRRLAGILEATPDLVGFADAKDGHILYVNKAGRRMVGLTPDEDVTRLKLSDVHPEWANRMFVETVLPAAARDGVWTGECAFLHRDGHDIPVLMSLLAHKNSSGEVEVFSTISRDITERKRMEEDLRETNEHLVQLIARLNTTTEEVKALMRKVVEDPAFTGRFANPLILRCWEAKKCNQATCPAYQPVEEGRFF